jgi:CRP-like cAMP-binding protein
MISGSNLLAVMDPADRDRIEPDLAEVELRAGTVLYEAGEVVRDCYFPRGAALASYVVDLGQGQAIEAAMVGREGALGGVVSWGQMPSYAQARVLNAGSFYRIDNALLERLRLTSPTLHRLFSRYTDCFLAQSFQASACNASHSLEQRAARWISAVLARTDKLEMALTQDQLARLLGVGRSYASRVIQRLKREGLVQTRRGGLTILDRKGLAARCCPCSAMVHDHYRTVLDGVWPD